MWRAGARCLLGVAAAAAGERLTRSSLYHLAAPHGTNRQSIAMVLQDAKHVHGLAERLTPLAVPVRSDPRGTGRVMTGLFLWFIGLQWPSSLQHSDLQWPREMTSVDSKQAHEIFQIVSFYNMEVSSKNNQVATHDFPFRKPNLYQHVLLLQVTNPFLDQLFNYLYCRAHALPDTVYYLVFRVVLLAFFHISGGFHLSMHRFTYST